MKTFTEVAIEEARLSADGVGVAGGVDIHGSLDNPPDPEVSEKPERRRFGVEYKLRVLAEADACKNPGEIGAILRREGLYSSHLSRWRQSRLAGQMSELHPKKRGPEPDPVIPFRERIEELERENASLRRKLQQAETVIEVQKKSLGSWHPRWSRPARRADDSGDRSICRGGGGTRLQGAGRPPGIILQGQKRGVRQG